MRSVSLQYQPPIYSNFGNACPSRAQFAVCTYTLNRLSAVHGLSTTYMKNKNYKIRETDNRGRLLYALGHAREM